MNEQNLKSFSERTEKEQREIQQKGGIASGKARREKRDLRKALELLLEKDCMNDKGQIVSGTEAITAKLFEQALKGNVKAFETIRSTVGQDPVQKVEQVNFDAEYNQSVEYVRRLMEENDE